MSARGLWRVGWLAAQAQLAIAHYHMWRLDNGPAASNENDGENVAIAPTTIDGWEAHLSRQRQERHWTQQANCRRSAR